MVPSSSLIVKPEIRLSTRSSWSEVGSISGSGLKPHSSPRNLSYKGNKSELSKSYKSQHVWTG